MPQNRSAVERVLEYPERQTKVDATNAVDLFVVPKDLWSETSLALPSTSKHNCAKCVMHSRLEGEHERSVEWINHLAMRVSKN
jgi:hypothetical protein